MAGLDGEEMGVAIVAKAARLGLEPDGVIGEELSEDMSSEVRGVRVVPGRAEPGVAGGASEE